MRTASVLEGLDRALVLAHHPGRLGDGKALREAERDALLLLRVSAAARRPGAPRVRQGLRTESSGERSTSFASSISPVVTSRRKRLDLKWSATRLRAIVTSQAPKSRPLPGEGADAAQGAQEGLAGEVLRRRLPADAVVDVAVHGVAVLVVEPAEGIGFTGLAALDQVHHAGAVAVRGGTARAWTYRTRRRPGARVCPRWRPLPSAMVKHWTGRRRDGGEGGDGVRSGDEAAQAVHDRCAQRSQARGVNPDVLESTGLPEAELPSRAVRDRSPSC